MAAVDEFRCFVGGLSWNTTDQTLEDAFRQYGSLVDAKVVLDRDTERSRGFGFVTFSDEGSMQDAIDGMHGKDLDGRSITVSKAQPKGNGGSRDSGGYGSRDRDAGRSRGAGGCFKCGDSGHWARDCTSNGGGDDRGRSGGGGGDRYGSRGGGGAAGRYSSGGGGGGGDRNGGGYYKSREGGGGAGRRSAPYDRPSGGRSRDEY